MNAYGHTFSSQITKHFETPSASEASIVSHDALGGSQGALPGKRRNWRIGNLVDARLILFYLILFYAAEKSRLMNLFFRIKTFLLFSPPFSLLFFFFFYIYNFHMFRSQKGKFCKRNLNLIFGCFRIINSSHLIFSARFQKKICSLENRVWQCFSFASRWQYLL